jgi:hypothetical protein
MALLSFKVSERLTGVFFGNIPWQGAALLGKVSEKLPLLFWQTGQMPKFFPQVPDGTAQFQGVRKITFPFFC